MKFNNDLNNPGYIVSDEEIKQIEEIKIDLLYNLDQYQEWERHNFLDEIEGFETISIKIEILERHKLNTINELAFSEYFYKEKCFFLNGYGHVNITADKYIFYSYISGYKMLEDTYKGTSIARNIVKVRLIELMVKNINSGNEHFLKKHNTKYLKIFCPWGFELLRYLAENFKGETSEEIKFTLFYRYLIAKEIFKRNRKFADYRQLLINEEMLKIEFTRASTRIPNCKADIFIKNEDELMELHNDFKELNSLNSL